MGRRLGQHFLRSQSILARIAGAACPAPCDLVIEIGPGKGALTAHLLQRAARVVAIEVDPVLIHYLRQRFREDPRLEIVDGDVLKTDLAQWGRAAIAGNLPYYITSPILERVFALGAEWSHAVLLMQKEVAERLVAPPGVRAYGYLTVQTRLFAVPELLFPVPRAAFHPPPNVESAVVRLTPRNAAAEFGVADAAGFLKFASLCFQHKRKTLRNNLAGAYGKERVDALAQAKRRAEQLSMAELAALYHALSGSAAI
ncbi:MAG: 16S rRNA (adenine(1518)-N(6)/adenine(1519)-N(6))-dimethyltransferase RsmA [Bryobacteraceae bacterium]